MNNLYELDHCLLALKGYITHVISRNQGAHNKFSTFSDNINTETHLM